MNKTLEALLNNFEMLDAIRQRKGTEFTVEILRESLGISRSTADKMVNTLRDARLVTKQERRIAIEGGAALFLGISIGSTHTRVQLLGLDFESVPREQIKSYPLLHDLESHPQFKEDESDAECLAYMTSCGAADRFGQLQQLISEIVSAFLKQAKASAEDPGMPPFPLMGIGLAVTGPVDYAGKLWRSAPRRFTEIRDISLLELIGYDCCQLAEELGIFFSLDNNAKTAMISEYQYLLEKNGGEFEEDIALLYIGSGIGSAAVLDGSLLRGSHNLSGELGYLRAGACDGRDGSAAKTIDECLEGLGDGTADLESYNRYLTYLLNTINCVLGIDRVILVGHSIRKNKRLIPSLLERRMQYTVMSTQHYCKPEVGREKAGTSAIGAAIESYMSLCHYNENQPKNQDRINLAREISWNRSVRCP